LFLTLSKNNFLNKKAHPADGLFLREIHGEAKKILSLTPTHTQQIVSKLHAKRCMQLASKLFKHMTQSANQDRTSL
jgi:hypothetical protein